MGAAPNDYRLFEGSDMTTPNIEELIAKLQKASVEIESAGHYGWGNNCTDALNALQSQAERIKELSLQVVSAFGQAQEALEERDTIRALPAQPAATNWADVGRLIEATGTARSAGHMVGTSNWAAHVVRVMGAQPAEPVNAGLVDACGRYEAALMAAFPNGAHGEAFTQWNEARKLLAKRAQAAPAVGVPDGYVLVPVTPTDEMRDAGNVFVRNRGDLFAAYRAMLAASPKIGGV